MEDILNSIRRIMADDNKPLPEKAPDPVPAEAELQESGSVEQDIKALRSALNAIRGEMEEVKDELVAEDAPLPVALEAAAALDVAVDSAESFDRETERQALVSPAVEQAVRKSFADLSEAAAVNRQIDVEAMAENLLRPMLQEWLDLNLPQLVEKLVREEIARLTADNG